MTEFFTGTTLFGEEFLNCIHINGGAALNYFMAGTSAFGSFYFYIACLSVIYWCMDKKIAVKIGIIFIVSTIANSLIKDLFLNPRPDPEKLIEPIKELHYLYAPRSPGFPSGHTQSAASFWGGTIYFFRKKRIIITGSLMILIIPYSRLFMGVHFLGDIIGGYIVAFLSLVCLLPILNFFEDRKFRPPAMVTTALITIFPWLIYFFNPAPFLLKDSSLLAGFLTGLLYADAVFCFEPASNFFGQFLKILTGLSVLALINLFSIFFNKDIMCIFVLFWLSGFWITFGAPLVFSKFRSLSGMDSYATRVPGKNI